MTTWLRHLAATPLAQWWAWKIETVSSGPDRRRLPPHPLEDPGYWEMIEVIREAWGQTCEAALAGVAPLDFEAFFLDRAMDDVQRAGLSTAGQQAAAKEIDRRLVDRRTVLANVRFVEGLRPEYRDLRRVRLMWRHREAGMVQYELCPAREHGWLAKINIELDLARGGLGRRALGYLTTRYPNSTWTTAGQMTYARGFWSTMQDESDAGWTQIKGSPCEHGWIR